MIDFAELQRRIRAIGGLPVFDSGLQELLQLIREEVSMKEIAKAIERDPTLAARVLKLANSAYYGMSREVSTLNMALVLLGLRSLRSMIMSIGLVDIFDEEKFGNACYPNPNLREHSFLVGRFATLLSEYHGFRYFGEEFVAGLVHDVGQLILWKAFPKRVEEITLGTEDPGILTEEKSVFGIDHAHAGSWTAKEWRLPETIIEAIRDHHKEDLAPDSLAALVKASDQLTEWYLNREENPNFPESWEDSPLLSHEMVTPTNLVAAIDEARELT